MLAPRGGFLAYSKVYCDVIKRWFLAWNQNWHITCHIFHIQYTNSEFSIGLLYICHHFVWWQRRKHCSALVRNLQTSILVRASVSLLTFHTFGAIFVYEFRVLQSRFQNLSICTLSIEAVVQRSSLKQQALSSRLSALSNIWKY